MDCSTVLLHEGDNIMSEKHWASNSSSSERPETPVTRDWWMTNLWHHGSVWQCPNCGSQKVRIMQARACRHSLQRSKIHLQQSSNAVHFTVLSKQNQKYFWVPFADYGSLALYVHSLMCSILCSALQNLHYLCASGVALPRSLDIFFFYSELGFQQRLFEWPAHRKFLPRQFIDCVRAAVRLFPQVVVTAHLSVWI